MHAHLSLNSWTNNWSVIRQDKMVAELRRSSSGARVVFCEADCADVVKVGAVRFVGPEFAPPASVL